MNVNICNEKGNYNTLKNIYDKIHNIFIDIEHKEMSIDDLVAFYSKDENFIKELDIIKDSMVEILNILESIEDLENEFYQFFSIRLMVDYLIRDIMLFLMNLSFINGLFNEFFNLIHKKLLHVESYEKIYSNFVTFLENQKDFFYTEIFEYNDEYEDLIIEVTNVLW